VVFIWGLCFRIALTWQTSKIALPHSHQDTFKSLLEPDLHTHTHTRVRMHTHAHTRRQYVYLHWQAPHLGKGHVFGHPQTT